MQASVFIPGWLGLLALAAVSAAGAQEPDLQVSGYGTVGATFADTRDAEYRASWQQSRGSRARADWGVDSRLGLQLNGTLDDTFSATAQVLAQRLGGREALSTQWMYAQAEVTPDLLARAGRVVLPAFMLSDVRNIGYSQHWVRTPYEVYLTLPPVDGVQLLYRQLWHDVRFTVQPTYGHGEDHLYYQVTPAALLSAPTGFRHVTGLHVTAERGSLSARIGSLVTDATIRWATRPAEAVRFTFTSLGAQYDDGQWLGMVEWMSGRTNTRRYDIQGAYVTAGLRFGRVMPYATVAAMRHEGSVIDAIPDGRTFAVGGRWDAFEGMAVKLQLERSRLSGQQFVNVAPAADPRRAVNVFTMAVDFVF